jgi:hypothetical protein
MLTKHYKNDDVVEALNQKHLQTLKRFMCDQNNLNDQYITKLKLKRTRCILVIKLSTP